MLGRSDISLSLSLLEAQHHASRLLHHHASALDTQPLVPSGGTWPGSIPSSGCPDLSAPHMLDLSVPSPSLMLDGAEAYSSLETVMMVLSPVQLGAQVRQQMPPTHITMPPLTSLSQLVWT